MQMWLLSLLVNNHFGVLTRVTALFSRRGYNIASLSVGETGHPEISRITIMTQTDSAAIHQIIKQLNKLEDVQSVALLPTAETIARELMIVKLMVSPARREALAASLEGLNCRSVHDDGKRLVLEFTGDAQQCERFLRILSDYTIIELCRTGITAISVTHELSIW